MISMRRRRRGSRRGSWRKGKLKGGTSLGEALHRVEEEKLIPYIPIFKGRYRATGYGHPRIKIRGGNIFLDVASKYVMPFVSRLFQSSMARKIGKTIGKTAAAATVNVISDKLSEPKVPLKTVLKRRGAEGGLELAQEAKRALRKKRKGGAVKKLKGEKKQGRRRVGRRRKKSIKRIGGRKRVSVKKKNKRRSHRFLRRTKRRKRDIFD
jgi:hypothetical protein